MRDSDPYDFDAEDIEHDPITDTYHLSFDPDRISAPAMVVVQLISYITDTSPLSLPQLDSSIDADSLDSWLSATQEPAKDFEVVFTYAGYQVTLDATGELWVQPVDGTGSTGEDGSG